MLRDTQGAMKRAVSLAFHWIQSRRLPWSLTLDCGQEHIKGAPISQTPTIAHIHNGDLETHTQTHTHTHSSGSNHEFYQGFLKKHIKFHSLHTAHDIYTGKKVSETLILGMKMEKYL